MALCLQLQLAGACGNLAGVCSAVPLGPAQRWRGRGGDGVRSSKTRERWCDLARQVESGSAGNGHELKLQKKQRDLKDGARAQVAQARQAPKTAPALGNLCCYMDPDFTRTSPRKIMMQALCWSSVYS